MLYKCSIACSLSQPVRESFDACVCMCMSKWIEYQQWTSEHTHTHTATTNEWKSHMSFLTTLKKSRRQLIALYHNKSLKISVFCICNLFSLCFFLSIFCQTKDFTWLPPLSTTDLCNLQSRFVNLEFRLNLMKGLELYWKRNEKKQREREALISFRLPAQTSRCGRVRKSKISLKFVRTNNW